MLSAGTGLKLLPVAVMTVPGGPKRGVTDETTGICAGAWTGAVRNRTRIRTSGRKGRVIGTVLLSCVNEAASWCPRSLRMGSPMEQYVRVGVGRWLWKAT